MLFVVYDKQGSGRVVGVFDDKALAERVVAVNPPYYEMFPCKVNEINPSALNWLPNEKLRRALSAVGRK